MVIPVSEGAHQVNSSTDVSVNGPLEYGNPQLVRVHIRSIVLQMSV